MTYDEFKMILLAIENASKSGHRHINACVSGILFARMTWRWVNDDRRYPVISLTNNHSVMYVPLSQVQWISSCS